MMTGHELATDSLIWCAIIICGIITFLTRFLPLTHLMPQQISKPIERALGYMPVAVLTPIIITAILMPGSELISEGNMRIPASFIAVLVAKLTGSIVMTLVSGLSALWLLNFLFLFA